MRILNIIKYDLIKLTRDKTSALFMFIMPVIFIVILGSINYSGSSKIPVGFVNLDKGSASAALISEINKDKTISFTKMTENDLYEGVKNVKIEMGFVIPEDFSEQLEQGKTAQINMIKLPSSVDFIAVQGIINSALTKMKFKEVTDSYFKDKLADYTIAHKDVLLKEINQNVGNNLSEPDFVTVENIKVSGDQESTQYDNKAFVTIGFMIMFVMFTVIFATAGVILEERKTNTWGRLIVTPTYKSSIVSANILSAFLKGWIQVVFLILFSKLLFGVNWGDSMISIIVLMSMFILCVSGMGIFLSTLIKTNAQLGVISSFIITCTTMVSGCYWPLEMEPEFMQKIAVLFPQYWAMKGMRNVIEGNLGFGSITVPALALLGMGLIFFIASIINGGFKLEIRKHNTAAPENVNI